MPEEVVGAVGAEWEVVAEVAVARFDVQLVADRAVPLGLVNPATRQLRIGLVGRRVGVGREGQPVGLFLLSPLVITNQLVLLVDLVGHLADGVPQQRVERLVEREVGLSNGIRLAAVGAEEPDLVLLDRATGVDVVVVVRRDLVAVRADRRVVERRRHDVRIGDVRALQGVVVPVEVIFGLERVAARAGDELALHAGVRHFRRLAGGAEERFFERGVVEVEAGAAGAFHGVDAFDQHAHLAGLAIGAVAGLRAGAVAADVDAAHLHGRGDREQCPHVTAVRDRLQLLHLEVLLHARRAGVDHRRRTADRHGLLQRREAELDVHLRGEAQADRYGVALERVEAGKLKAHRVGAGRHRRETVVARFRGHRRLRTEERRTGGRDRHARQNRALRIRDATLNRTRAAGATALCERGTRERHDDRQGPKGLCPTLHASIPSVGKSHPVLQSAQGQTGQTSCKSPDQQQRCDSSLTVGLVTPNGSYKYIKRYRRQRARCDPEA